MILIVDDKQENIFSLKTLLEINHFTVDTALSGEEALKKVLRNNYVLIILDVQMPNMDGFEVAEALSGHKKVKDIPIIFLSAVNTEKRFITKGYESGGFDYVVKPFDPDILLLKVKNFYRMYEQTVELNRIQAALKAEIEERKKIENELEKRVVERTSELQYSNRELEKANDELRQFAWVATHDLQEPLRKIQVFSTVVKDKYLSSDAKATDFIDKVLLSSRRMTTLIHDLLSYTSVSEKDAYSLVDLNEIISNVLTDLELQIQEKQATVEVSKLSKVEMVPVQASQVFLNLIGNSLKYARAGVPAKIIIKSALFTNAEGIESCNICITDNGIGFSEQYLEKIFTIFQRLHRKEEYEGTGIGLAIVKKIVEGHNGAITAKSKENEGATFIITLPLRQQ